MTRKLLKTMGLLLFIWLITVFLLDYDGTFGLFMAFMGIPLIWNS